MPAGTIFLIRYLLRKEGLTQITYAEEILKVGDGSITVKRHIDGGVETVEGPLPIVITVNGSAAPCRPRNAKLVQKYKHAKTITEKQQGNLDYTDLYDTRDYLNLVEWSVADVNGDLKQCGLSGSPTKVKAIQNIVFQAKESKTISGSDREVEELIVELICILRNRRRHRRRRKPRTSDKRTLVSQSVGLPARSSRCRNRT